jgi:4-amino-4-deoxy-L-arabinose transferase-like glycosyltransferase
MKSLTFSTLLIFLLLALGVTFRLYNINFDNLWVDEILSFWIANPDFDFKESYLNHKSAEKIPFLFNFIIKFFFTIFGYDINLARIIPCIFSIFGILSVIYLSKLLSKKNAYIFAAFLTSFNIFLIGYSQELRVYSTLFFFINISLIFFYKSYENDNKINHSIFIIVTLFSILLYPFSIILYIAYCLYTFLLLLNSKIENKTIFISLFIILLFSILYYVFYFQTTLVSPTWINQPELKFFTNFYFSKFFGSRLVGLLFLITLIFLSFKHFSKIIRLEKITLIFIFLILSYMIPLVYTYMIQPILISRYIIFVLIPIIILISHFTFELKNNKIRFYIIFALCLFTLSNFVTEQTFKQFYKDRRIYKPEFVKSLKIINDSNNKNYSLKVNPAVKILKDSWANAVNNYLDYIKIEQNLDINFKEYEKLKYENIWIICVHDINKNDCALPNKFISIEHFKLNRLDLILASIN